MLQRTILVLLVVVGFFVGLHFWMTYKSQPATAADLKQAVAPLRQDLGAINDTIQGLSAAIANQPEPDYEKLGQVIASSVVSGVANLLPSATPSPVMVTSMVTTSRQISSSIAATVTLTPTATQNVSATATAAFSATAAAVNAAVSFAQTAVAQSWTATPTPTQTSTQTPTPVPTNTPMVVIIETNTSTPTPTQTPTSTPTNTPTPNLTATAVEAAVQTRVASVLAAQTPATPIVIMQVVTQTILQTVVATPSPVLPTPTAWELRPTIEVTLEPVGTIITRTAVYTAPGEHVHALGFIPAQAVVKVIGRNGPATWIQIEVDKVRYWLKATYIKLENGSLVQLPITWLKVPDTGGDAQPTPAG